MKKPTRDALITCLAVLLYCWASLFIGEFSPLVVPAILVGSFVAIHHKSWAALCLLVVLNPLFVIVAIGVSQYIEGAPTLSAVGLPSVESFNVDRSSRCFRSGGGCLVHGGEWLFDSSRNAALRLMSFLFGPPAKSYDGPYPTKEEAERCSSDAPETPVQEFLQGNLRVDHKTIFLGKEIATRLVKRLRFHEIIYHLDIDEMYVVKATLYQHRCLVLRISDIAESDTNGTKNEVMILFDTKNNRPFAYFALLGNFRTRTPPLHYLAEWDR